MRVTFKTHRNRDVKSNMRGKMLEILEQGAAEYDYLKELVLGNESMEYILEQVGRLFEYLIKEKKNSEQKYERLLELHNNLIDANNAAEERYSAEYIYKLADENDYLRKELNRLLANKIEFETRGERTEKSREILAGMTTEPEKMQERIDMLEKKLETLERTKSKGASKVVAESRSKRLGNEKLSLRRKGKA